MLGSSDEVAMTNLDDFVIRSFYSHEHGIRDTAHSGARMAAQMISGALSGIRWYFGWGVSQSQPQQQRQKAPSGQSLHQSQPAAPLVGSGTSAAAAAAAAPSVSGSTGSDDEEVNVALDRS
jgi:hypothetical protein